MSKYLTFFTSTELLRVLADAVVFITADGNYSAITMVDGNEYVLTLQLGQIEHRIADMVDNDDNRFIRIGKSLIINRQFITYINPARQKLTLSNGMSFRHDVSASRDALKALKELFEKETEL